MKMNYAPTTKIWIQRNNAPISNETLERLTILVEPKERSLEKRTAYEVLAFVTEFEWETCNDEKEMKQRIFAKFRFYDDAEEYAQRLVSGNTYYHTVVLRK
jgi:hypothetical protein